MYDGNNIAERIKNLAKAKNISVKIVLEKAELNYNLMTTLRKSIPKADNLAKIADVLECSTDYLLGRTDIIEINKGE